MLTFFLIHLAHFLNCHITSKNNRLASVLIYVKTKYKNMFLPQNNVKIYWKDIVGLHFITLFNGLEIL